MLEDERWAKIEAEKNGAAVEGVAMAADEVLAPAPDPAAAVEASQKQKKVPGKKKGLNNRKILAKARERLILK